MILEKKHKYGILILIIVVIVIIILSSINLSSKNKKVENLAKCLTVEGIKLYGVQDCGHCDTQKEMFGESLSYITYVDCVSFQNLAQECVDADIVATPTWIIDGHQVKGVQNFETLAELSGCKYN